MMGLSIIFDLFLVECNIIVHQKLVNNKSFFHRFLPEILLIALMGIILFSSVNHTHDWGGDFAQYLDNARDLITKANAPGDEVLDGINFAPASRGAGFSLLIAPVYLLFGDAILHFTIFISVFALLVTLILFKFYQKSGLNTPLAFLLTLIFILNPATFQLKFEILPTFPFLALLYIIFIHKKAKSAKQLGLLALLVGCLISIRNVGWVCYLSLFIHVLISWVKHPVPKELLKLMGFALIAPLTEMTIKWLVFGYATEENLSWYGSTFHLNDWSVFWDRLVYNYDQLLVFFKPTSMGTTGLTFGKLMIAITFLGWGYRLYQKHWGLADTFTLCYGLILLLYEGVSGIRFLIPVLPMALFYWIIGIIFLLSRLKEELANRIKLAFLTSFLLMTFPGTWTLLRQSQFPIAGPNTTEAQEAFDYIQQTLSEQEVTAFHKPWVFHYYTDRVSMPINPKTGMKGFTMPYLVEKMKKYQVNHILVSIAEWDKVIYNSKLIHGIREDTRFIRQWQNESFALYSFEHNENRKNPQME